MVLGGALRPKSKVPALICNQISAGFWAETLGEIRAGDFAVAEKPVLRTEICVSEKIVFAE